MIDYVVFVDEWAVTGRGRVACASYGDVHTGEVEIDVDALE